MHKYWADEVSQVPGNKSMEHWRMKAAISNSLEPLPIYNVRGSWETSYPSKTCRLWWRSMRRSPLAVHKSVARCVRSCHPTTWLSVPMNMDLPIPGIVTVISELKSEAPALGAGSQDKFRGIVWQNWGRQTPFPQLQRLKTITGESWKSQTTKEEGGSRQEKD